MSRDQSSFDADLIILGGGCAGLSLASRLAHQSPKVRVVVLEARTCYQEDRTWCGWRTEPHFFDDCVVSQWNQWRVINPTRSLTLGSASYPYQMLNSKLIYEKACNLIRGSRSVNLMTGAMVKDVIDCERKVTVCLGDGTILTAPWAVDTRPQQRSLQAPWLWQNFVGYVVHLEDERQGMWGSLPTLMDFQPASDSVAQFMYILPLSANSYLCEWTRFAKIPGERDLIEAELRTWLDHETNGGWTMERQEFGSLPMAPPLENFQHRIVDGGTRGGSLRASTGYAFHAIQRWADTCAASIVKTGIPVPPRRNRLIESMDELFLRVLQQESTSAALLFSRLFGDCDPDQLVRFLAGIPRYDDLWAVVSSLPWPPFLLAAPSLAVGGRL